MMTTMIFHNLKVAVRNLMKYKLQTIISVLSIAIGIVTLAFTHSLIGNFKLPPVFDEPYADRAYILAIKLDGQDHFMYESSSPEIVRTLKAGGGLKNAEKTVFSSNITMGLPAEFHLPDSTVRKGSVAGFVLDSEYPDYAGLRSALTGKKIRILKPGEAIVSEDFMKNIFKGHNPVGAIQTLTSDMQPIPLTIVDVYKTLPVHYRQMTNDAVYYCLTDSVYEPESDRYIISASIEVVLKDGRTEGQLIKEIEQRLKPWNAEVTVTKISEYFDNEIVRVIKLISYLAGCLILVAAIIGFLRMQIQLVRLRTREISLRIVNGASRMNLFTLLMLEIGIVLGLAVIVSVILGYLLQDFIYERISLFLNETGIAVDNLWVYSVLIGGGLFLLCGLIVYLILHGIAKSRNGLASSLRKRRNHLFRNVMLGIQVWICLVFVCCSFILINAGLSIKNSYFIPDNDDSLKEYLSLRFEDAKRKDQLRDEVKNLTDLENLITLSPSYLEIKELSDNPEAQKELDDRVYLKTYLTDDVELLHALDIDVNWTDRNADHHNECMLVQKELYDRLDKLGLLDNNALTIRDWTRGYVTFRIAGTFSHIPYEKDGNLIIAISTELGKGEGDWLLIPKPGKAKSLARNLNETMERIAPESINKNVFNYREHTNPIPDMFETFATGGWILGCVSLIICVMGIFSTITLDTRARKKEVAIRKVNGAKSGDIYRMFGKVYAWLILLSLIVAVPVSVLFGKMINTLLVEIDAGLSTSFVWPIVLGCIVVIIFILGIVYWQIRRVMRVDPAKIIAKE